ERVRLAKAGEVSGSSPNESSLRSGPRTGPINPIRRGIVQEKPSGHGESGESREVPNSDVKMGHEDCTGLTDWSAWNEAHMAPKKLRRLPGKGVYYAGP